MGFGAYRIALVVARRYSPFKAFFQLFVAALFFMLLLLGRAQPHVSAGGLPHLFGHRDATVRALAAEVAGFRGERAQGPGLVELLADDNAEVRRAAHDALVRLNAGVDLGSADDLAARTAWKERFK